MRVKRVLAAALWEAPSNSCFAVECVEDFDYGRRA